MKRVLAGCSVIVLIAAVAFARADSGSTSAQSSTEGTPGAGAPAATVTSFGFAQLRLAVLVQADIDIPADGSTTVSVATITLGPGLATQPFVTEGTLVISVQAGSVQLDADNALIGAPDIGSLIGVVPVTATAGPANGVVLQLGKQAVLQPGTTATVSNPTDQIATLLLVSLAPAAADAATLASPAP